MNYIISYKLSRWSHLFVGKGSTVAQESRVLSPGMLAPSGSMFDEPAV